MEGMITKVIQNHLEEEGFEYDNQVNFLDLSLRDDIDLDSFEIIDLILKLETELKVTVPDDLIHDVKTVKDVIEIVKTVL